MKKIFTLLSAVCLSTLAIAQTYPVGNRIINFKDDTRTGGTAGGSTITIQTTTAAGRSVSALMYYPSITAGANTAAANGQFPVVVIGHGFVMAAVDYTNIAAQLASKGYIVALPKTENEGPLPFPAPNHLAFGTDLKFLASAVQWLNTTTITAVSSFNGKVMNKTAIGGHSMGGGCSFIGAANNTTLTCFFSMAAALSNTAGVSSVQSGSLITVPALVISGELDSVADSTVQNSHYAPLASTKKFHTIIKGVAHCDFGNGTSGTCTIGQAACSGAGCNAILLARYMAYLVPFLDNQLKNDCAAGNTFMTLIQNPSTDRVGRKITGTLACASVSINEINNITELAIYPNPSTSILNIDMNLIKASETTITITDNVGRVLFIEKRNADTQYLNLPINCEAWSNGIYFVNINAGGNTLTQKFVKL